MGWKHIDTLQMGPPSNKERVLNMDKVASRKEVVDSNIETKGEILVRKKLYADIVIHGNNKWNSVRKESIRVHLIINDNLHSNLYSINDNSNSWIHCKPSDVWCIVTMQVQTSLWPSNIDIYRMFRNINVMYKKRKIIIRQCTRRIK